MPPPVQPSSVSLSDLLTAAKNIVTAINGLTTTLLQLNGTRNFTGLTAATVVSTSPGRLVQVSVIVAGSGTGTVYDATTTTDTSRPIYKIPQTVGVVDANIPVSFGIVVAPGTGQTVSGGFS